MKTNLHTANSKVDSFSGEEIKSVEKLHYYKKYINKNIFASNAKEVKAPEYKNTKDAHKANQEIKEASENEYLQGIITENETLSH